MWNSKKIASAILLLAFVALAPGCVYDNAECPDVPPGKADAYLRLQLRLEVNSGTRSNPTGGEDGDGREEGQDNECAINRLDLVIYNSGKENAINTDGDAVVKRHLVFFKEELNNFFVKGDDNGDNKNGYYLVPLHNYSFAENDRILAYANAPGLDIEPGDKISSLKDLCPYQTWTGKSAKEANNFTMATARWNYKSSDNLTDGKIYSEIGGNKFSGGENDPFYARCTIERTAARIDFMYCSSDKKWDRIIYSVISPSLKGAKTAEVWITNILPVNLMQKPSYFFKHVTNSFEDMTVNVCQGETPDPKGLPTNYVMEPTTLAKKGTGGPSVADLFGLTAKSDSDDAFGELNAIGGIFADELIKDCKDDSRFDKYCILAYTNENTWTDTDFNADFMTGLAFKAIYKPETVYKTASATDLTDTDKDTSYQPGTTIYRFSPTRIPEQNRDSGFDVYFSNREAAVKYDGLHPELNGIITEYKNAVCYYNLWLRHANYEEGSIPDPAEAIPMEYVIVRNNIYRVGVTFSGPGNPDPELREPHNILSRIFVRKWNVRRHSTIIM